MSADDSGAVPLDGEADLTAAERRALRGVLRDAERASWARKKLAWLVPVMVGVVTGVWQLFDWAAKHIKFTP